MINNQQSALLHYYRDLRLPITPYHRQLAPSSPTYMWQLEICTLYVLIIRNFI